MIIPAIDFQGGTVVQLIQGEQKALERDLQEMLELFRGFPVLQIIDLDAAKGEGNNGALVERCCRAGYRVRVGGGIRSVERARQVLDWGAEQVIVASAAFRDGKPDFAFLESLQALRREHIMLGVDARNGQVAVGGWRKLLPLTSVEAVRLMEPYTAEFLFTNVDTEGLMQGIPLDRVREVRAATNAGLTVAGGISSLEEIDALEALRCNSVLGMSLYTGKLPLEVLRQRAMQAANKQVTAVDH